MSYASVVLADNPVNYWRGADPGGNLLHDIGNTPIHLAGGFAGQALGYSGIASDSGSFWCNNSQSYSFLATRNGLTPISIEAWVWPHYNDGGAQTIFGWDGNTGGVELDWLGTSKFAFTVSGIAQIIGTTVHNAQSWYHVVGTYDEVTMRLWVNALQEATFASALHKTWILKTTIGSTAGATNFCKSNICEVATYNYALSPTQITNHFLAREVTGSPVFKLGGVYPQAVGGGSYDSDSIKTILASVRRTFST